MTMPAHERSPLLKRIPSGDDIERPHVNGGLGHSSRHAENGEAVSKPEVNFIAVVIPMAISILLVAMDGTIVVSSYAAIGSELEELQNTSWIATSYLLTLTSFQPLYGKLSDIFGRKNCLLFACVTFAIGCLLCGLAQNMTQLIAARAFAGIGGGGLTTVTSIIMSDIIPLRSRGTWQGILNIIFATGSAIGAPLGGLLAGSIGWRWSFLIQVPAMVIAIATVAFALHIPTPAAADFWSRFRRVDFLGAITLVTSIFFLLLGLNHAGNVAWSDKKTVLSLVAFAALFLLFCVVEMTVASEPFAPKRIVMNRSLIASYMVNFFGVASAMTMVFHISLYYQAARGMTAIQVGLWLLPSILAGVAGSLGGGLIMQASGKYYWLTISGCCSLLIGSLIVVLAAGVVSNSMAWIAIGFVVLSLGNGNSITASLISLIANAGAKDQAIATAMSYLFRSLGNVVGLSVGSTLTQNALRTSLHAHLSGPDADLIIHHVRESLNYIDTLPDTTRAIVRASYEDAVHVAMWFAVALAAAAAVFSLFIKETSLGGASSAPVAPDEGREGTDEG